MSGPNNFQYEKSILGCGPLVWAGLWNKRVWADYEQLLRPVFPLFRGQKNILNFFWKHHSVRTEKLHRKKVKKKHFFFGKIFFFQKNLFFLGLKFEWNLSVNTERSGPDYCWLYCGPVCSDIYICCHLEHTARSLPQIKDQISGTDLYVFTLKFLALKKTGFSPKKILSKTWLTFVYLYSILNKRLGFILVNQKKIRYLPWKKIRVDATLYLLMFSRYTLKDIRFYIKLVIVFSFLENIQLGQFFFKNAPLCSFLAGAAHGR